MIDKDERLEMIGINKIQERFYDKDLSKGLITGIWDRIRNKILNNLRTRINAKEDIYSLHKNWAGKLDDTRILDLGCYAGNELSLHFARNAKEYLGIDLSQRGIDILNGKLKKIGNPNTRAKKVDFLSNEFDDYGKFDIIYIYSAMHHFQYLEILLDRLDEFLNDGGLIITYDPLQTYWLMRLIRIIYRPFQSDSEWEFPFDRDTFKIIEKYFKIEYIQGILNRSKWGFLLNFLPINFTKKSKIIRSWHRYDMENATSLNKYLYGCLHVTMLLRKPS